MNGTGMAQDWYVLLGVGREASPAEIRSAYRRQAREYHPDRNPDPSAQAMMAAINEARAVLLDPARRAEFDRTLPAIDGAAPAATPRPTRVVRGRPFHRPRPAPPVSRPAPDWYAFLGVSRRASSDRIAAAVSQRSEEFDRIPNPHTRAEAQSRLLEAWRTLRDPASRDAYDRSLEA